MNAGQTHVSSTLIVAICNTVIAYSFNDEMRKVCSRIFLYSAKNNETLIQLVL